MGFKVVVRKKTQVLNTFIDKKEGKIKFFAQKHNMALYTLPKKSQQLKIRKLPLLFFVFWLNQEVFDSYT